MSNIDSNPKLDLRVVKTYKLLCNSLLDLLKDTSFDKVSVKDICKKAMVNRSTFYMHFEDKYHLLTYGLKGIIEQVTDEDFKSDKMEELAYDVFENVFASKFLYTEILLKDENSNLKTIFHNQIAQDIKEKIKQKSNVKEISVTFTIISEFYAAGILSVISWWVKNNMSIPAEVISMHLHELLSAKDVFSSYERITQQQDLDVNSSSIINLRDNVK